MASTMYEKAVSIADRLLARGYPVVSFELIDYGDALVVRFGGDKPQQIRAEIGSATLESFAEAYDGFARDPAWSRR